MVRTRNILVVDDEPDVRDGLADALESAGYAVETAENGREALARLRARRADLVLLDLMMPVMDGWQFRDEQKRDPGLAGIPVVVVTASGAELRDVPVLRKPFDLSELLRAVARECGR